MKEYDQIKPVKKFKFKISIIIKLIILVCVLYICLLICKKLLFKNETESSLINPILNTNVSNTITENKNINLEYYLQDYSKSKIANWDIINLSVYFRNMNNGNRFWIEEKEEFSPASLMKLPLLLAYFKISETEPWFLEKKVIFTKNWTSDTYRQNIAPSKRLEINKEYKLIDIITQMIKYSDNEASAFLEKNLDIDLFKKVFTDVWIEFPPFVDWSFDNNIRIVDYAAFFRVLFNSSYLNKENSERVLNLLTKTQFKDGLIAWVSDNNITVSHKFGERSIFWNNWIERMQLHDCWIIYYPEHPYLLCIMSRWYDWNKLKQTLQEVSNIVYEKVDEAYSNN